MSATSAPSKALKVRPLEAKHYKLRHPCTLPNSLLAGACWALLGLTCYWALPGHTGTYWALLGTTLHLSNRLTNGLTD